MGIGLLENKNRDILDACLGLVEEAAEVIREGRHVLWRPESNLTSERSFEESVDVFFYLLEYWILTGRTAEDVIRQYLLKFDKNMERIKDGSYKDDQAD